MKQTNLFPRRRFCGLLLLAAALLPASTLAQTWPSRPVHIIVPFGPGGPTDILTRLIAPSVSASLKQSVVVENKPGAGGMIGMAQLAKSSDGHTFGVSGTHYAIGAAIAENRAPSSQKPFDVVSPLARTPYFLLANASVPANSARDLVAKFKNAATPIAFASSGLGTGPHLAAEVFSDKSGVTILNVPYTGTAAAVNDVLAGHAQLVFTGLSSVAGHVASGRLKILGVASRDRVGFSPNTPTLLEQGLDVVVEGWFGVVAPPIHRRQSGSLSTRPSDRHLPPKGLSRN